MPANILDSAKKAFVDNFHGRLGQEAKAKFDFWSSGQGQNRWSRLLTSSMQDAWV
jgi:hypothetical protein